LLFSGRTHIFSREVEFNTEYDYLQKLNEFQSVLCPKIKAQFEGKMSAEIDKLSEDPIPVEADAMINKKKNRRNKIKPRF